MDSVQLTVTVDDAHIDSTADVARSLADAGFKVDSMVVEAGAIFGSASAAVADRLTSVAGVEDVRPSESYQLPPFDEAIPQ